MPFVDSSLGSFDFGLLSPATVGSDATVSDRALATALLDAEFALVAALADAGIAPDSTPRAVRQAIETTEFDLASIAARAVGGGNPVIPLIADLRDATRIIDPDAAIWVHRGATSQDILDTALMLLARLAIDQMDSSLAALEGSLATLADRHRATLMAGRTLTQHSTPVTFGLAAARWLSGVLDARARLGALVIPAQLGGASGTLASFVAISDEATAATLPAHFAAQLGLDAPTTPWHSNRATITAIGDAVATVTDALGVVAGNVTTLSRTEIAEVAEPGGVGRGGSSAMPQKRNPAMSVLVRSATLRVPLLAASLHLAAADSIDERPDGAWHSEWPTLRELLRIGLGTSAMTAELVAGLQVNPEQMLANLSRSGDSILAERAALTGKTGEPADYLGLTDSIISEVLARVTPRSNP